MKKLSKKELRKAFGKIVKSKEGLLKVGVMMYGAFQYKVPIESLMRTLLIARIGTKYKGDMSKLTIDETTQLVNEIAAEVTNVFRRRAVEEKL